LHLPIVARALNYPGMSQLETVVEKLKTLQPSGLAAAADFIHQLKATDAAKRKHALDRTFGCLSANEADEMERAIAGLKFCWH
jgi:hypothetical protein